MLRSLQKYKKQHKVAAALLLLAACLALAWFTLNTPEQGRNLVVTTMEKDSALFFATERDISALAHDVHAGAASSIGLASEFALVSLLNGDR